MYNAQLNIWHIRIHSLLFPKVECDRLLEIHQWVNNVGGDMVSVQ